MQTITAEISLSCFLFLLNTVILLTAWGFYTQDLTIFIAVWIWLFLAAVDIDVDTLIIYVFNTQNNAIIETGTVSILSHNRMEFLRKNLAFCLFFRSDLVNLGSKRTNMTIKISSCARERRYRRLKNDDFQIDPSISCDRLIFRIGTYNWIFLISMRAFEWRVERQPISKFFKRLIFVRFTTAVHMKTYGWFLTQLRRKLWTLLWDMFEPDSGRFRYSNQLITG